MKMGLTLLFLTIFLVQSVQAEPQNPDAADVLAHLRANVSSVEVFKEGKRVGTLSEVLVSKVFASANKSDVEISHFCGDPTEDNKEILCGLTLSSNVKENVILYHAKISVISGAVIQPKATLIEGTP